LAKDDQATEGHEEWSGDAVFKNFAHENGALLCTIHTILQSHLA